MQGLTCNIDEGQEGQQVNLATREIQPLYAASPTVGTTSRLPRPRGFIHLGAVNAIDFRLSFSYVYWLLSICQGLLISSIHRLCVILR